MGYDACHSLTRATVGDPSKKLAASWKTRGHRVSTFILDWEPEGAPLGATHCYELPLFFGDEEAWKNCPSLGDVGWEEWERRGKALRQAWGKFARDGSALPLSLDGLTVHGAI